MSSHRSTPQGTEGIDGLSVFCGALRWLTILIRLKTGINKETSKMNQISWGRAVVSGVIGVISGLVITYVVSLINHTTNLQWSLIAVGFASFFAASAGYLAGAKRKV